MGCTSSATNMATPQMYSEKNPKIFAETGEQLMEDSDEVIYADKENKTNAINVLPTCDNLGESTQLARNNKSFIDTSTLDLEKDIHANGQVIESSNETLMMTSDDAKNSDDLQTEDKLSSLEEVVEKVVEMFVIDNALDNSSVPSNGDKHDTTERGENHQDMGNPPEIGNEDETTLAEQIETVAEEMASPSQSESSRATRWEALADIAAELPPSHTVDPVTGQIYALSK